jgi:hypothetical protein
MVSERNAPAATSAASTATERRFVLFDRQRTDDAVRQAMTSASS